MDASEIERYLAVSRDHSIYVDVAEVVAAPGYVRTIRIDRGFRVTIEYEAIPAYTEGSNESGWLSYTCAYENLEALLLDLESFLGRKVSDWRNYSAQPLRAVVVDGVDFERSHQCLMDLVRSRSVPLPPSGTYEISGPYWRHIAEYGEFRLDEVLSEDE